MTTPTPPSQAVAKQPERVRLAASHTDRACGCWAHWERDGDPCTCHCWQHQMLPGWTPVAKHSDDPAQNVTVAGRYMPTDTVEHYVEYLLASTVEARTPTPSGGTDDTSGMMG